MLSDNAQRYLKALLPLAFLLIFVPLVDITLRTIAVDAGGLQQRFGAVGMLFGNLGTVILGISIAGAIAALTDSRGLLRAVGAVSFLLAVVLLALLALFALDAVQMRRLVAVPVKRQILTSSVGAMISCMLGIAALAWGGRAALRASRVSAAAADRRTKAAPSPLVAAAAPAPAAQAPRARAGEPV